jgi:Na+(H+)/acetate symporter ActP
MRAIGCLVIVVVGLVFFLIPMTGSLSLALAILGVSPDVAVPVCLLVVVAYIVWGGVKTFFG